MILVEDRLAAGERKADRAAEAQGWGVLRRLHMARRAERTLMSYERSGWLEGEPTRTTSRSEIRPSADMGPIICCLDTSGSMHGARETVAKVSSKLHRCRKAPQQPVASHADRGG